MGQKFFISFNSADRTKAHWIAWTLKEAGHEVAVHDWELPAGGNVPLWMNTKLAWADRLIGRHFARLRAGPLLAHGMGFANLERPRRHEGLGHSGHCQANIQDAAFAERSELDRFDELFGG